MLIPGTSGLGGFKFGSSKWGSEFETFPKIKTEHVSCELLVIVPCRLRVGQAKRLR